MDIRKSLEIVSDQNFQGQSRERLGRRTGSRVQKSLGSVFLCNSGNVLKDFYTV